MKPTTVVMKRYKALRQKIVPYIFEPLQIFMLQLKQFQGEMSPPKQKISFPLGTIRNADKRAKIGLSTETKHLNETVKTHSTVFQINIKKFHPMRIIVDENVKVKERKRIYIAAASRGFCMVMAQRKQNSLC